MALLWLCVSRAFIRTRSHTRSLLDMSNSQPPYMYCVLLGAWKKRADPSKDFLMNARDTRSLRTSCTCFLRPSHGLLAEISQSPWLHKEPWHVARRLHVVAQYLCGAVRSLQEFLQVQEYDYIVVGCGGIGSAAVYWLAKRAGKRVLGLEQFNLGHDNGGSQDHSRIIRKSYDSCAYIALARGTYEAWGEAERESGVQLVYKTGGLDIAKKGTLGHAVLEKFAKAMKEQDVDFERFEGESIKKKFPQFAATPQWTTLFQKESGLVDAAMGNAVHIQLARMHGATVIDDAPVLKIVKQGNLTKVCSSKGDFLCRKVIVTAGAWMNDVLSSIGIKIPLTVTQEQVTYFGTPHMKEFTKDRCPVFILHTGKKAEPYFLPLHGNTGFKIGLDVGGPVVTAQTRNFVPDEKRREMERNYVAEICPRAVGPILYTKTCLYTMTPDRNFVIDTCKKTGHPNVIFCCGAGHAFKFAAVLGRILSQLAIDGRTTFDISCFNMERPAISDPNFPVSFQLGVDVEDNTLSKL